jgi:hypothetical protein
MADRNDERFRSSLMKVGAEARGGFTLLDGAALVIGAAVASVHMREAVTKGLTPLGWVLVWVTFAGVALSAAGPFVFVARRYGRRPAGYPRIGDWLWALLGLPWLITALLRPSSSSTGVAIGRSLFEFYRLTLWIGLGSASLLALAVIWKNWVMAPPGQGMRESPTPWTERVGLILAIGWPLQCGFGLVVAE